MNESKQRVAQLEQNIVLLLNKLKDNHYALESLRLQLEDNQSKLKAIEEEKQVLRKENDSLTMANSLLGSNESNATTKHKINALIQQVDTCIDQLQQLA
jgi:Holliday junction resolvasome RuvABC endonuclease subunit